jgi:hypothetical protein
MNWDNFTIISGGIATLAIFSFLIKENGFYRFFEHLFIGIAAGFGPVFALKNFLWPKIIEPMFGLDIITFPDGTLSKPYSYWYLIYIIPALFGLLYYTIYTRRFSWMVKIVIGFSLGAGASLAFKGFFAEMLPQIFASFKPLLVFSDSTINWTKSINNIVFLFTLIVVMYYFFFSFKHEGKASRAFGTTGRLLMMVCFGAFFGSTVMARLALLVERLQFLINDWYATLVSVVI